MSDRLYRFFDSLPCRLGLHPRNAMRYPGPCYCRPNRNYSPSREDAKAGDAFWRGLGLTACPCGGDRIGGSGCTCPPPF